MLFVILYFAMLYWAFRYELCCLLILISFLKGLRCNLGLCSIVLFVESVFLHWKCLFMCVCFVWFLASSANSCWLFSGARVGVRSPSQVEAQMAICEKHFFPCDNTAANLSDSIMQRERSPFSACLTSHGGFLVRGLRRNDRTALSSSGLIPSASAPICETAQTGGSFSVCYLPIIHPDKLLILKQSFCEESLLHTFPKDNIYIKLSADINLPKLL